MARSKKKVKVPEGRVSWYVWNKYMHAIDPLLTKPNTPKPNNEINIQTYGTRI